MKNIMQKVIGLPLILFIGISIIMLPSAYAATQPNPMLGDLSAEDMKMLEDAQKQVESYVNSLPSEASLRAQGMSEEQIKKAETREKFEREVERLSKMSEEELIQEIEKAINEATTTQPPQAELPQPIRPIQEEEKKPIAAPSIPTSKQQAALQLIDNTIVTIGNFLRKAQMMVELPSKIPSWSKQGKLKGWPTNLTWNSFKNQIEELETRLHKLRDRDIRTNTFKYLDDFIKDESLYNNLSKVKDTLTKNEPKIELSPFGIDKMTSAAREATRTVLLSLHEAITNLAIPAALDKIFEKYEPTAKKIKESEEAAQRRAFEESKKPRVPGAPTTAGIGRGGREGFGRERERGFERGYRPGYEPLGYPGYKPEEERSTKGGLGAPGAGGAGGKPGAGEAKKAGEDKKAAEDKKSAAEKAKYEPDKKADFYEKSFIENIDTFKTMLDDTANFKNIERHIFTDKSKPIDEEAIANIRTATKSIGQAVNAVKNMKKQLNNLNEPQKKAYKKSFKDSYKDVRSDLDKLLTQINNLNTNRGRQLGMMTPNEQRIFKTKFYAYFGKKDEQFLQDYVDKARATAGANPLPLEARKIEELLNKPSLANMDDLKTKISDLNKAVEGL